MKILVHGATNCGSSNFGDYIYIDAIARHLEQVSNNNIVELYDPSDYFKQYLPKYTQGSFKKKDADCLVYAPGGYFGEGHGATFKSNLVQFMRFMPVGLRMSLRKKPILVVAIGAGPNSNPLLSWAIKRVCAKAISVTVRDHESKIALENLGIQNVIEAGDLILTLPLAQWAIAPHSVDQMQKSPRGKRLLIHYNHSAEAAIKFAEAVNCYINENADEQFEIVVTSDQRLATEQYLLDKFQSVCQHPSRLYSYDNPYEMIGLINSCDYILTCKLHVGVVGAMLGVPVVCAAEHPEKTKRFYKQIKEEYRCESLYLSSASDILKMMNEGFGKNIHVPAEEISKAAIAWESLDSAVSEIE